MSGPDARDDRFRRLYAEHFDAVLGFALRRTDRPEDAADVTAETFLVAWRREPHVPDGDAARPWLYGVARRVLANHRRGEGRRVALGDRLRQQLSLAMADLSAEVVHRTDVTTAMVRLSARDEEVLQLHLWEGLESRRRSPRCSGCRAPSYGLGCRGPRRGCGRSSGQRSGPSRTSPQNTPNRGPEGGTGMSARPRITDQGVAGLSIAEGRAELLEEIMENIPAANRSRRGVLVPLAAAATVVAVAGGAWALSVGDQPDTSPRSPGFGSGSTAPAESWSTEPSADRRATRPRRLRADVRPGFAHACDDAAEPRTATRWSSTAEPSDLVEEAPTKAAAAVLSRGRLEGRRRLRHGPRLGRPGDAEVHLDWWRPPAPTRSPTTGTTARARGSRSSVASAGYRLVQAARTTRCCPPHRSPTAGPALPRDRLARAADFGALVGCWDGSTLEDSKPSCAPRRLTRSPAARS